MAERYSQLFTLPTNLYSEGSPVLIEAGALLRDNVTGGVLAQLKIKSISNKIIKALTVGVIPCDIAGRRLSNAVMHQYLDMNFERDSEFGQKNAIALPDPATRSFKVYVSEAVFGDNSIYSAPECEWTPLNVAQKPVGHTVLNSDPELSKNVCCKCGAELQDCQESCPKCGQKIEFAIGADVSSTPNQFNAGESKSDSIKNQKPIKLIVAALVAVAVIAIGVIVVPKLFTSIDDLCAQGDYEKAFEKASGDMQVEVLAENVIAYLSEESSDRLKNPDSFVLREGYHYAFINENYNGKLGGYAVLSLSGTNSVGASITNYILYIYSPTDHAWDFWGSCNTTADEDDDELSDTLIKYLMKIAIDEGYKLTKDQVNRINAQFEADTLYQVTLIDIDTVDPNLFKPFSAD